MSQQDTADILRRAADTLDTARLGLVDVKGDPARRHSGLRNLVVFGRAVTNVLQNLRSIEPSFDAWYEPVQRNLIDDPLMRFFYELRTRILKKGDPGVGTYARIKSFQPSTDLKKFGSPPKRARSFFIGDSSGGTGWEVEVSPGVVEKYYVELPSEIGAAGLLFRDAPGVAGDGDVSDSDVVALSARYIDRLQQVLDSAIAQFSARADV